MGQYLIYKGVGCILSHHSTLGVTLKHPRAIHIGDMLWDSLRACMVMDKLTAFDSFEQGGAIVASLGEVLECGANAVIRLEEMRKFHSLTYVDISHTVISLGGILISGLWYYL